MKVAIIGGGAAGFFSAIACAQNNPKAKVEILEKTSKLLSKVKVSGGGRCNVTNATFTISELQKSYPRGAKQLKKVFHQFMTNDTVEWFESKGVKLKAESDKRMFPITNNSQSIIDCLLREAVNSGVTISTNSAVAEIKKKDSGGFLLVTNKGELHFDRVIVTTGGNPKKTGFDWLAKLNHKIETPVPSLFTFNLPKNPITKLMGLSVPEANVRVVGTKLKEQGPLLITHWGLSGPAILKLSAWGARLLADKNYAFNILVSWVSGFSEDQMREELRQIANELKTRLVSNKNPFQFPQRLWDFLLQKADIPTQKRWCDLSKKEMNKLLNTLISDEYEVRGKTTFKEEFVTCGGISLQEVDFQTMESRACKGLYFAGEVLDIDGITGGFNFQAAWSTGFVAGLNAGKKA